MEAVSDLYLANTAHINNWDLVEEGGCAVIGSAALVG